MDIVIRHCSVLVVPPEAPAEVLADQDLVISGDRIAEIGPTGTVDVRDDAEIIDGTGLTAVPGLANCHSHSPMVLMRGAAEDLSIEDWFNTRIWPMEVNLTPDGVHAGARLACAEMLLAGVTAFADHYFYAGRIADAAAELGIRADLAPTYFSSLGVDARESVIAETLALRGHSPLVSASFGPHATYTVDETDLARFAEVASVEGLRIHIHTSETIEQTRASQTKLGVTPIEVLRRTGVLDAGALIAHGTGIVPSDLPVLAEFTDRVGVACCPKGYFKSALDPMTPIRGLRAQGIPVGVGTDGAASGNTLDVWEQTRLLAMAMKRQEHDATFLTVEETLRIATRGGATVFAGGGTGALEPGAPADVVLVDLNGPHCQPIHDPLATMLYSMRASDVVTVLVAGRLVVRNRRLLTADVNEIIATATAVVPGLSRINNYETVQTYAP